MKPMLRAIYCSILLSLPCSPLRAQDDGKPAPPAPPFVGTLSGDFSLVKKFTYLTDPSAHPTSEQKAAQDFLTPDSAKVVEYHAVEKGTARQDLEIFADGSSLEIWRVQAYRLSVSSKQPDAIIVDVASSGPVNLTATNQYRDAADFPELSWIERSMYQGIQTQQGHKCYAYKQDDQTAWIDAATKYPVYYESKTLQVSYTYSDAPSEEPQMPKGYAEKLEKFKRVLRGQL